MLTQLLADAPFLAVGLMVFTAVWLVTTILWLWTLWDCLTCRRVAGREKTVWVIALLCTHVVGALLYLVLVRWGRAKGAAK